MPVILPKMKEIPSISQIHKVVHSDPKLIIHSNNLIEKTNMLDQFQNTNLDDQDQMDTLIKDMLGKLKKGKI